MMEYKGYVGRVEVDDDAETFHGEVINTRDVITFEGTSVRELRSAFRASVEDYLSFCAERDEVHEKPCSGQFVTRITSDLHRRIHVAATRGRQELERVDRRATGIERAGNERATTQSPRQAIVKRRHKKVEFKSSDLDKPLRKTQLDS